MEPGGGVGGSVAPGIALSFSKNRRSNVPTDRLQFQTPDADDECCCCSFYLPTAFGHYGEPAAIPHGPARRFSTRPAGCLRPFRGKRGGKGE